jgi:hypothetical protein
LALIYVQGRLVGRRLHLGMERGGTALECYQYRRQLGELEAAS